MKEPQRGTVSKISSTKITAECKMATGPPVKANEPSGVETEVKKVIKDKKQWYHLSFAAQSKFHCEETGIKFEAQSTTIIKYSLEYGDDYMKLIQENGYELLGPIFNVQVISGRVSAVYLPHYVCLEDLKKGNKSMIKFGHFKDGMVTLRTPDDIEASHLKLKEPTFSCVAAVGEISTSFWKKNKPYSLNGQVLLYARLLCGGKEHIAEFRIHLYFIPADMPCVKELTKQKKSEEFQKISKPHLTKSVYTKINYSIIGEPHADVPHQTLTLTFHKEIENLPFIEINFPKNEVIKSEKPISFCVVAEKSSDPEPVWKGRLTRADIEELLEQADHKGYSPKNFIGENYSELVQNVTNIMPVLDDLKRLDLLRGEAYTIVTRKSTPQEQMRSLLQLVESWGSEEQDTFLEVVTRHNKSSMKKIEKGN